MNKLLLNKIQNRLKEINIRFETTNENIHFGMNIGNLVGNVNVFIQVFDNAVLSYAVMSNKTPSKQINKISEFLHRANYGLLYGNFEIDYEDGEIRYKMIANCQDAGNFPNSFIDRLVLLPCEMIQKYGDGIMKLMIGDGNPRDIINEIEETTTN